MNSNQKKIVDLLKHKAKSIQIIVNQDEQELTLKFTDRTVLFQIGLAVQSFYMNLDKPNRKKPLSHASDFF